MRCKNATISAGNIKEVEILARRLLSSLNDINFILTAEEQQGLFSIIEALAWEPVINSRFTETPEPQRTYPESARLKELLQNLKIK